MPPYICRKAYTKNSVEKVEFRQKTAIVDTAIRLIQSQTAGPSFLPTTYKDPIAWGEFQ